ncbi:uncharacterized protein LACBIDRAFT_323809 [Laccaria bicolor S238N-H82]|uniref:Predicted protein n=1 Tax=Laccaria bicolor (strain S238N-H82 / ATCC MYA-4686) TaxID=486041 RepID=B0CYU8_LACBS|nr:uncharacterized protein LACBIDRAFT_323809 [Laccaria bicolor S238N-H82]EDR12946.1 predicted protein [Laccaria bicolor S238N-H82]|eukprot:XP_001877210.1 predicted protein [Laccaria bicolor S238N-H82]
MAVDLNAPYAILVGFGLSNEVTLRSVLVLVIFPRSRPNSTSTILVMNHQRQSLPRKRILETYDAPEPKRPQLYSIYEQFPQLRDPDKKLIAPPVVFQDGIIACQKPVPVQIQPISRSSISTGSTPLDPINVDDLDIEGRPEKSFVQTGPNSLGASTSSQRCFDPPSLNDHVAFDPNRGLLDSMKIHGNTLKLTFHQGGMTCEDVSVFLQRTGLSASESRRVDILDERTARFQFSHPHVAATAFFMLMGYVRSKPETQPSSSRRDIIDLRESPAPGIEDAHVDAASSSGSGAAPMSSHLVVSPDHQDKVIKRSHAIDDISWDEEHEEQGNLSDRVAESVGSECDSEDGENYIDKEAQPCNRKSGASPPEAGVPPTPIHRPRVRQVVISSDGASSSRTSTGSTSNAGTMAPPTFSIPSGDNFRHVVDACLVKENIAVIGYANGPCDISILRLVEVWRGWLWTLHPDNLALASSESISKIGTIPSTLAAVETTLYVGTGQKILTLDIDHPTARPRQARCGNATNHLDHQVQIWDKRASGFDRPPKLQLGYRHTGTLSLSSCSKGGALHSYFVKGYPDGGVCFWDFRNVKVVRQSY